MEGGGGDDDDDGGPGIDACPCPGGDAGGGDDDGGGGCAGSSDGAAQPFGNHVAGYAAGSILPDHLSQAQLDDAVRDFYDYWKGKYLASGCGDGRRYVAFDGDKSLTVSEAHGYGMVILAYMAGHDPDARAEFDGMVAYYLDHPSANTPGLMAWSQSASCANNMGPDSASDGDLDIAYALLLADKQWSSGGAIDYRGAADAIIAGIRAGDVDEGGNYVRLGDWTSPGDFYDATRSSDFMPDHLASFAAATGDPVWSQVASHTYEIMDDVQTGYAPETGLLPDFIQSPLSNPRPVNGTFLENPTDGEYSYNACRDPWRIATDFLVNGDPRSKTIAQRMNTWIQGATGGNPDNIRAGYSLAGEGIGNYVDTSFVAPFGVAAMVDASNQAWLNSLWDAVAVTGGESGYYGDTITMLSLITMSGNWWSPESAPCP
jgi:endo-1,4-beta-D-glucanase Y